MPIMDSEDELKGKWTPVESEPKASPAPPVPNDMPSFFQGSISPLIQHDTSFVATEVGSPRVPKYSLMPFGAQNNPQINAAAQSAVEEGGGGGGDTTKVPFSDITTGDNTGALMRVAGVSTLTYYETGVVNANEIGGIGVAENVPDHAGQLLISQPGNATAAWADPQVQGLYAAGDDIDDPPDYTPPTTIQPVLIGAEDEDGLLQNVQIDDGAVIVKSAPSDQLTLVDLLQQILFQVTLTNRILMSSLDGNVDIDDFTQPSSDN
jgi:hypothetical protein